MRVIRAGAVGICGLAGCSPLPGPSLDPFYLKEGLQPGQLKEGVQPGQTSATQTSAPRPGESTPGTSQASMWVGRYRDSRGEGDITLSLVRGASTISGTWRVRTGGGGPLTGSLAAGEKRF